MVPIPQPPTTAADTPATTPLPAQATHPSSPAAIADDLFCQNCGYNLRTLISERCPECGDSIAGVRSLESQIPWVHRKQLGRWRAYWKTVWMVMFRRRQLAEEVARPISYGDAQLFRLTTVAIVCGAAILASLSFRFTHAQCPADNAILFYFWKHPSATAVMHFFSALMLLAATGLPSYFFHPHALSMKQQNRAVALSYYTCAPLALSPVPIGIAAVAIVLGEIAIDLQTYLIAASLLLIAVFAWWWVQLIFLARRTMPQCRRRVVSVTIFVPMLWLLSGLLIFVALPAVCFFVWIVFASLM